VWIIAFVIVPEEEGGVDRSSGAPYAAPRQWSVVRHVVAAHGKSAGARNGAATGPGGGRAAGATGRRQATQGGPCPGLPVGRTRRGIDRHGAANEVAATWRCGAVATKMMAFSVAYNTSF